MKGPVPLHPEVVPGHTDQLRWVLPPGAAPFTGPVGRAPDGVARLLSGGVLTELRFEPDALLATLASGRSWRDVGPAFREALSAGLTDEGGWCPAATRAMDLRHGPDHREAATAEDLASIAREVIDGAGGDEIRSHGGTVDLVEVAGDEVVVRLGGACRGCPAADATLQYRLEAAIRARYPQLARVRRASGRPRRLTPA